MYEFMLRENYNLDSLSFSVIKQDIILTAMRIYDADLVIESGKKLFESLFEKADDYDNALLNLGGVPYSEEE